MDLKDDFELEATRNKLRRMEQQYELAKQETEGNPLVRQLSLRTLKRLINQLTEEIIRYEIHRKAPANSK